MFAAFIDYIYTTEGREGQNENTMNVLSSFI